MQRSAEGQKDLEAGHRSRIPTEEGHQSQILTEAEPRKTPKRTEVEPRTTRTPADRMTRQPRPREQPLTR